MSAYLKKIAVIKQVKGGFSADGGNVSGLVKAETYAGFLKVEVSLINFAPLTEGRYVLGITDGLNTVTFEGLSYEGEEDFNLSSGFAFLVCFCNNTVAPVASASCGEMACALPDLKGEMTKLENIRTPKTGTPKSGTPMTVASDPGAPRTGKAVGAGQKSVPYDDEAISEVNYYERTFQGGSALRQAEAQKEVGLTGDEDAQDSGALQGEEEVGLANGDRVKAERKGSGKGAAKSGERARGGLAGGDFYGRMEAEIKKIFATYPKESELEKAIEGGRFVKISYGEGKYYVFGVMTVEGRPRYICYGVPSQNPETPPPSLKDFASYIPTENGGYWMTYQDAGTGVSVKLVVT